MSTFDVIVVGVGAMGASTCHHLAKRGVRVLGLEQFDIPHALGSSTGFSRMIRMAYYEHPDYVPLLRRAYELWHELEAESGQKLLHLTSGLYIGRPDEELIRGSRQAAEQHQLPHELLDRRELTARFPQFTVPDDHVAMIEPNAGFLLPEKVIATYADRALRLGAELHGREPVLDWSSSPAGVTLRTTRATYEAAHVIFCGGAWSDRLLRDLYLNLTVTRQVMGWVWPKQPQLFEMGTLPVWAIGYPDGSLHYGFPIIPDCPGLKIALHAPGPPTDPDRVARDPQPGDEATFRPALQKFLPSADGPLLAIRTCLYTNSPDHHFILDRHPQHANVTLVCGFSGHGFKFTSIIGQIMADLALEGMTNLPAQFLSLARFDKK
ncbi:MAG TPA: N-methyl-L-tryptophan oxidase [Humisphaera sp.]|jgi:sarcosine oxidase|nr:N-methyl-L-tryptophan oxidase [Humisphaera sp.]